MTPDQEIIRLDGLIDQMDAFREQLNEGDILRDALTVSATKLRMARMKVRRLHMELQS